MKIYNIHNSSNFIETLKKSTGDVEITGNGGKKMLVNPAHDADQIDRLGFLCSYIPEVELKFSNNTDRCHMLKAAMRNAFA